MRRIKLPSRRALRDRLAEHFGFRNFRPGQLRAVRSAMEGRDVVVVMPTGSGKSVCFQLPALELVGTTVVVSPLIALIRDQAEALKQRGISVAAMNSTLTAAQWRDESAAIAAGQREFVIHYHVPGQLEALYQEFGRAGRDGQPARCSLLYDPEDRKLQRFFQGGRYPDDSDLVNAYHALSRFDERGELPNQAEIHAGSPLPKTRMKVCLSLFSNRGIVQRQSQGRYRLLRPGLTRDEVARTGQSYRERAERDLIKQQQIADYAERPGCRWQKIVDYFGGEELPETCGHCDRCAPPGSV